MASKNVKPLLRNNYLAILKNSVGSKTWQNLFAQVDGQSKDILKCGQLSCAFFVSSVLVMFGLIKKVHATVSGTIKDLVASDWSCTNDLSPGCVVVWEVNQASDGHQHIGFCISDSQAVSTDFKKGLVIKHHLTFGQQRKIIGIYTHKKIYAETKK